jgi:hypothetical protein
VGKLMRGIRIASFTFAALLVCLLISRVLTVDPPRPQNNTILDEANGAQPNVPPPPAIPESKTVQPIKKPIGRVKAARPQAPVRTAQTLSQEPAPADAKPVIWTGSDPVATAGDAATPPAAETAPVDEPKPPVIIVADKHPKEDSRGIHWLKAMGHALGIGKPKDPAEEAFR